MRINCQVCAAIHPSQWVGFNGINGGRTEAQHVLVWSSGMRVNGCIR